MNSIKDPEIRGQRRTATVFTYGMNITDALTKYAIQYRKAKIDGWFTNLRIIILPRYGSFVKLQAKRQKSDSGDKNLTPTDQATILINYNTVGLQKRLDMMWIFW